MTKDRTFLTRIELSERQRQLLLVGGLLNSVRGANGSSAQVGSATNGSDEDRTPAGVQEDDAREAELRVVEAGTTREDEGALAR